MSDNKQTGRDDASRAACKDTSRPAVTPVRVQVTAAIGRAALWGLLPIPFAERLIRWARLA